MLLEERPAREEVSRHQFDDFHRLSIWLKISLIVFPLQLFEVVPCIPFPVPMVAFDPFADPCPQ